MAEDIARVTEYTVSAVPEGDINRHLFAITVAYRGRGRWAVLHYGSALGSDGEWDHEPMSSSRDDDWLATHRFDEQEALRLARQAASTIRVGRRTAAQYLAATAGGETRG